MQAKHTEVPAQYQPGWLNALDGRYALARNLRQRYGEIASDLGGVESLSYAKRSLIERALFIEYWIAQQEQAMMRGEDVDIGRMTQANNALLGLYRTLGLERKAREVPSLHEYLHRKRQERQNAEAGA